MSLTAVAVTYNSADCIAGCLRSIEALLPHAQRLVVDNGSTDATLAIVRRESPDTTIVEAGGNLGFGQGCNLGVRSASHPHVLLLNPDVALTAADAAALERLLAEPELGLVVPLLADSAGAPGRHHVFAQRHWVGEALEHALGPLRPRALAPRERAAYSGADGWASGAMLLVRRDEFERAGGFSPDLFLYYEDRDLSARYRRAGLPLRPTDALAGVHAGGASSAPANDGADRMAYSFLGFVEYLHEAAGETRARRAAHLTLAVSAAVEAALAAAARVLPRVERVQVKRRQVATFRRFVRGSGELWLPQSGAPYAQARRIIASM